MKGFNITVNVYCDACGYHRKIDKIDFSEGNDTFDFGISSTCPNCMVLAEKKEERVTPKKGDVVEVKNRYFPFDNFYTGLFKGRVDECITTQDFDSDYNTVWDQWRYPGEKEWRD